MVENIFTAGCPLQLIQVVEVDLVDRPHLRCPHFVVSADSGLVWTNLNQSLLVIAELQLLVFQFVWNPH